MDAERVVEVHAATMVGIILVEESGQNRIAIAPGALDPLTPELVDTFREEIASADVLLVRLEMPVGLRRRVLRRRLLGRDSVAAAAGGSRRHA